MGISDWSSDVCSSDLSRASEVREGQRVDKRLGTGDDATRTGEAGRPDSAPDRPAPDREGAFGLPLPRDRSEEHTSELQSLMRISYAVFCLKKKQTELYLLNKKKH